MKQGRMRTLIPIKWGMALWIGIGIGAIGCGQSQNEPTTPMAADTQPGQSDGQPDESERSSMTDPGAVVEHYARLVRRNYDDSYRAVLEMREAINSFLTDPSEKTMENAREAWVIAHVAYGPSEAFRFYDGPIDDARTGPEGRINGWPLDELYVDYVQESDESGIINNLERYPTLDTYTISEANELGGEENIALGFHAIEFLLWGQDFNDDGPGSRPHTDYVKEGTAPNPERRGDYLRIVTEILAEDLERMVKAWDLEKPTSYASRMVSEPPLEGLLKIITGIGMLASDELSGERMAVAYDTADQEDEQSCFSDTTHLDLIANAEGIRNVYLGAYRGFDGPSLSDLVQEKNSDLDGRIRASLEESLTALKAIPTPLDQVIESGADSTGRAKMLAAIESIEADARLLSEASELLGFDVHFGA